MSIGAVKEIIPKSTDTAQIPNIVRSFSKKELDTLGTDKWIVIDEKTPEQLDLAVKALENKSNDLQTRKTGDVDTNQWHITAIDNRITAIDAQLTPIAASIGVLQPIIDGTGGWPPPTAAQKKEYKKLTKDRDTLDKEKLKLQQDRLSKDVWLRTAETKFTNGTTANVSDAQTALWREVVNYKALKSAADAVNYTDKKVERDFSKDDDGNIREKWFKWWKLTLDDTQDVFFHGLNYNSSVEYSVDKKSIQPKWAKVKIDKSSWEITLSWLGTKWIRKIPGLRSNTEMPEKVAFTTQVMIPVDTQIRNPTTLTYDIKTTKLLHNKKYDITLRPAEGWQSSDTEEPQNAAWESTESNEKKHWRDRKSRRGRMVWATWAAVAGIFGFGGKLSGSAAHTVWWAATLPLLAASKGVSLVTNPARTFIDEAIVKTGKNLWNKKYFNRNNYNQSNKPTAKSRGWFIKNVAMSPYILAKWWVGMGREVAKAPFRWTYKWVGTFAKSLWPDEDEVPKHDDLVPYEANGKWEMLGNKIGTISKNTILWMIVLWQT